MVKRRRNLDQCRKWNTFAPMAIKRRKPADARKEGHLRVRIAEAHLEEIKAAAAKAGISISAWATERLLKCARQENKPA